MATEVDACATSGPGVNPDDGIVLIPPVLSSIFLICYLQLLLYVAFLLLPFSGKFDFRLGRVSTKRADERWRVANEAIRREARERRRARTRERMQEQRKMQTHGEEPPARRGDEPDLEGGGRGGGGGGIATPSSPPDASERREGWEPPVGGGFRYDRLMDEEEINAVIEESKVRLARPLPRPLPPVLSTLAFSPPLCPLVSRGPFSAAGGRLPVLPAGRRGQRGGVAAPQGGRGEADREAQDALLQGRLQPETGQRAIGDGLLAALPRR